MRTLFQWWRDRKPTTSTIDLSSAFKPSTGAVTIGPATRSVSYAAYEQLQRDLELTKEVAAEAIAERDKRIEELERNMSAQSMTDAELFACVFGKKE